MFHSVGWGGSDKQTDSYPYLLYFCSSFPFTSCVTFYSVGCARGITHRQQSYLFPLPSFTLPDTSHPFPRQLSRCLVSVGVPYLVQPISIPLSIIMNPYTHYQECGFIPHLLFLSKALPCLFNYSMLIQCISYKVNAILAL